MSSDFTFGKGPDTTEGHCEERSDEAIFIVSSDFAFGKGPDTTEGHCEERSDEAIF